MRADCAQTAFERASSTQPTAQKQITEMLHGTNDRTNDGHVGITAIMHQPAESRTSQKTNPEHLWISWAGGVLNFFKKVYVRVLGRNSNAVILSTQIVRLWGESAFSFLAHFLILNKNVLPRSTDSRRWLRVGGRVPCRNTN